MIPEKNLLLNLIGSWRPAEKETLIQHFSKGIVKILMF